VFQQVTFVVGAQVKRHRLRRGQIIQFLPDVRQHVCRRRLAVGQSSKSRRSSHP